MVNVAQIYLPIGKENGNLNQKGSGPGKGRCQIISRWEKYK
jgi:hypothetical protein